MSDGLRKLIEAVEAGIALAPQIHDTLGRSGLHGISAYNGSVDAAIALCEALLPGWIWGRYANGVMWVAKRPHTVRAPAHMAPARALLLAVLRAKLMEASHE